MNIEEIPADEIVIMTSELHRLFNAGGCNPACHGCWKKLEVGDKFKLATINVARKNPFGNGYYGQSREVMLCDTCSVENVQKENDEKLAYKSPMGCYRVNGKIVK